MKGKIFKISVAIILIMTLTLANFIFVGSNIVSYAMDGITTNHKNIEFETYFKDKDGNKLETLESTAEEKEMSIYLLLNIKREGYFNGVVELKDTNFKFNSSESEYVNKVEENKIYLNQLNAGTQAEIEIKVSPIEQEKYTLKEKENELILSGEYKDSTQKDIKIEAKRNIKLNLIETNDKTNIENTMKIITNKVAKIAGQDKRIIQVSIDLGLKNDNYPMKQITSKINVPIINNEKPEIVKNINLNSMSSYEINEKDGEIEILLKNEPVENNILWKKTGNENIILTYIYDEDVDLKGEKFMLEEKVVLQNDKEIIADKTELEVLEETVDSTIEVVATNSENEIFKGKLNSEIERQINSETKLIVNLANIAKTLSIKENQSRYIVDGQEIDANIIFNKTIISKVEFDTIFGENGNLQISNENGILLATVDKNSKTDENGNIVVDYTGKEPKTIEIRTTQALKEGELSFYNTKTIKETDSKITRNASEISTKIAYNYEEETEEIEDKKVDPKEEIAFVVNNEKEIQTNIQLKDSVTEATLELNKDTLSTVIANQLEMKVTLKVNDEKYDLNKNPIIKIDLPNQVENININNISLLYEEELKIKKYYVEGRQIILELEGEQKTYRENTVEGTNIIIDVTVDVNRKSIAKDEKIVMNYTNENVTTYAEGENGEKKVDISIVPPKDVTAINSIKDLGIETIGQEENEEISLERGKTSKKVEVGFEIINNNSNNIENVNILGTFPTKTEENNIDMEVSEEIDIENAKVYYSENEDATKDLQDSKNGWAEQINNGKEVKKYLVVLDNIEAQTSITGTYKVEIPENLEYNQIAKEGYETSYTNSATSTDNTIKATTITMQTGVGPKLETSLNATVGGQELKEDRVVKNGEVIKYTVKVSNTGSEDVEDIYVVGEIPEGTKLVEPVKNYEYTGASYYKELDTDTYRGDIEKLAVGETAILEYELRINKDLKENKEIKHNVETKYLDVTQKSNEIKCMTQTANLRISAKRVTDRSVDLYELGTVEYYAIIENISDKEQKDVKIKTNMSNNIKPERVQLITGLKDIEISDEEIFDGENLAENEIKENESKEVDETTHSEVIEYAEEMNIGNLKPGEIKVLDYNMLISQMKENDTDKITFSIKAVDAEKEYTSNEWKDKLNSFKVNMEMVTNVEEKYVKSGDVIEYSIKVKNDSKTRTSGLKITDKIPAQLTITKIEKAGKEIEIPKNNNIEISDDIEAEEELNVKITTVVNHSEARDESEAITNKAIASVYGEKIAETSEITHIIKANETAPGGSDGGTDGNENGNDNDVDDNNVAKGERNITGIAWFDENANGKKDENEKVLSNIKVKLLNLDTNKLVKDKNGKILEATTNDNGIYVLSNLGNGSYIAIFEYNNTQYSLTKYKVDGVNEAQNSDVRLNEISLEGKKQNVASTDVIKIEDTDIANINIGLIELKDFDLKLDKTISKVIIQNSAGTSTKEYNDEKIAKAEIDAKQLKGTTVIIEYKIKVSNIGEVAGYARKIADYIPKDLQFSSEMNKDWYQVDNVIYSSSIANDKIESGESRTLTLTLTKEMNDQNLGLVNNRAEIVEAYNDLGLSDINSTPGNQDKNENDYSFADMILSIKTGKAVYISIGAIIAIIAISGIVAAVIVKRKNAKEE